eukprot:jgi/Botrbrau1/1779/Bobra.0217s0034.1
MPGLLVARRFLPEGCRARVGCQLHKARVGCHPRQATNIASQDKNAPGRYHSNALGSLKLPSSVLTGCTHALGLMGGARPKLRAEAGPNKSERGPTANDGASAALSRLPLVIVGLAVSIAVFAYMQGFSPAEALTHVENLVSNSGALGPIIFIGAYAVATVFLIPGSVLTLAAGYLFGPVLGTAVVSVASTLGASLAFLVSRYVARPFVESRLGSNPKFAQIDAGIAATGAKVVFLLRLSPLVPFTLLNYMLGLTRVPFLQYVGASWAGMLPGTIAYVGLGALGSAGIDAAGGTGQLDVPRLALYAVGAVATLWATKILSGVATQALSSNSNTDAPQ